eukprot:COSAG02_NODE_3670_length_6397_cov_12.811527_1_plen_85_part_00
MILTSLSFRRIIHVDSRACKTYYRILILYMYSTVLVGCGDWRVRFSTGGGHDPDQVELLTTMDDESVCYLAQVRLRWKSYRTFA